MISTSELIAVLTANPTPVRRLRPPLVRATWWLLLAGLLLVLMATGHGMRPNLLQRLEETIECIGRWVSNDEKGRYRRHGGSARGCDRSR